MHHTIRTTTSWLLPTPRGALGAAVALLTLGLTACSGPEGAAAEKDARGHAVLTWSGGAARLCVTDPDATCPESKDDKVAGGQAYWVIDATCFNAGKGFSSPVTYGVTPNCAKDVTEEHGGTKGGLPLLPGQKYKVTITGFGGSPTASDFEWE
jgi:hypothetical protein